MADHDSKSVPPRVQNLIGNTYGRWTVIAYDHVQKHKYGTRHYWKVECDCGNIKVVRADTMKCGDSKSCGCLNVEKAREKILEHNVTHGMSDTPIYAVWWAMITRCENPNHHAYDYYGGRGINVCKRWRESFEAFYEDMGDRPTPGHTLERIDNSGDYKPSNTCWATRKEQARNRRSNHLITYKGETLTAVEWGERMGLTGKIIVQRIERDGWSVERALTEPIRGTE